MKNILFITPIIGFGGAEKMLSFVANSLQDRDFSVSVVNINSVDKRYAVAPNSLLKQEIRYFEIATSGRKGLKRLEQIRQIKKIAKDVKADIIIGFTFIPNAIATIVGKSLRVPTIISERGDPSRTIGNGIIDRLLLAMINRSTGAVFQTNGAKEFYGKKLQKNGKVIANPIFVKGEIPLVKFHEREKTIVSVGRLDNDQKRYDIMLKAFQLFHEKHTDYVLKLYGEGIDKQKIQEWCEDLGLQDCVRFIGLTRQPMVDIAKDGVFLITSDYEGISNALLEAMATGLPVVSTDSTPGGARMLIEHRKNGFLVPIGDAMAIANALCECVENSPLAERCGDNAKQVLQRFAPEKIIDEWEEYINRLTIRRVK